MVGLCSIVKKIKGFGIFIEAFILGSANYFLMPNYHIYENIEKTISLFRISSISVTDIIALLTSLLLAMGFIYHIGYKLATRIRNPSGGFGVSIESLKEAIIPIGAIFFIPLLIALSLKSGLSGIEWFISINIGLVFVFGLFNELIVQYCLSRE